MSHNVHNCQRCQHRVCARDVPIFAALDSDQLGRVVDLITRRRYIKGEMIVMEGGRLKSLVIINQGKAKAFRDTKEGKEQILHIFTASDFFGERSLLRNENATYNVEALEETHICLIRQEDFQELLTKFPSIALKVMEELCIRLDRLEKTVEGMGAKSVEARVSACLLEFADKYGSDHPKGEEILLPLSRQGIADYIGVTRETVSRKLSMLQDEGIIEMVGNKKVIILNREALQEAK